MSRLDPTASPPNESAEAVATGVSLGSRHWSICHASGADFEGIRFQTPGSAHAAPSILVPRFGGEPLRLDTHFPTHPRGSGQDWPPEARVGAKIGSGRFPLAAAWSGRRQELEWQWAFDNETQSVRCIDAVASAFREFVDGKIRSPECAFVIPNDLQQREQQRILDTCFGVGPNVVLIWRPIAAALAVLDTERVALPSPSDGNARENELCVVHADWGHIECTRLQVTPWPNDDPVCWVPARRRPQFTDLTIAGFGWEWAGPACSDGVADEWARSFASNELEPSPTELRRKPVTESNLLRTISGWDLNQSTPDACATQVGDFLASSEGTLVGLVVVGDFAEALTASTAWREALNVLDRNHADCTLVVEPGIEGDKLLSHGAAVHLRKLASGEVSYLDTLPSLELFVDRNGSYEWYDLLGRGDQFVQGGKEWTLPEPVRGLAVRRGTTRVKLVVAHEEFHGVRELSATLGESAEQRIPAELHVSCTPAQGNAKLLLQMESPGELPRPSIRANWNRMTVILDSQGREVDKEKYLQSQPRAFPELRPRKACLSRWRAFESRADAFLRKIEISKSMALAWTELSSLLDAARISNGTSAVGSNGRGSRHRDSKKIDEVVSLLYEHLKDASTNKGANAFVCKTLGFMSAECDGLEQLLYDLLEASETMDEPLCIICGGCIRSPRTARIFVSKLLAIIPRSSLGRLLNYHMRALGWIFSMRDDVLREIPERDATQLVIECLKVFEHETNRNNLAWLFEHSGLVVVYLLRYRTHNTDFLDPDSGLAIRAKELFRVAIKKLARRKTLGQAGKLRLSPRDQRLKDALQQLIDYIDKRGTGVITIAQDAS